ncbi:MAG: cysteine dioxygenase [Gammaproteobacteria bacterium]|nr:cysteine dioxygenase [Gammaproteobacteria bacterium]
MAPQRDFGSINPLREFVLAMTALVDVHAQDEATMLARGGEHLARLVAHDDWLPERFATPHPEHYQQYLLYCDPLERFSVISFVWGPGQRTPIHDHTVWGLIGMLRGAETAQSFSLGDGPPTAPGLRSGDNETLEPGMVSAVSPRIGDIHQVSNALGDRASISIHVYGANMASVARHTFDPHSGASKPFVSGYSATEVPNLWDCSASVRCGLG